MKMRNYIVLKANVKVEKVLREFETEHRIIKEFVGKTRNGRFIFTLSFLKNNDGEHNKEDETIKNLNDSAGFPMDVSFSIEKSATAEPYLENTHTETKKESLIKNKKPYTSNSCKNIKLIEGNVYEVFYVLASRQYKNKDNEQKVINQLLVLKMKNAV